MFTKNKRNYRTFLFSAVIVTLSLLVIALAWPVSDEEPAGEGEKNSSLASGAEKAEGQTKTGSEDEPDSRQNADMDEDADKTDSTGNTNDEENDMNAQNQSYYLVKRAGEQIAVFFCDEEGNTVQLENTEILYDMLGPEDQKLFEEGIRVKSQEELSVLLQDFES